MSDRAGGDGNRRPTKAEKKEEARLERDQIQRKMAGRKRNRNLGIVAIAVAVVAIVVVFVVVQPGGTDDPAGALPTTQQLLDQAPDAATSAGCDEVQTVGFYGGVDDPNSPDFLDQSHIGRDISEMPVLTSYPSIPPTSGPHAPIPPGPMPAGVYDEAPDLARAIHSLEHGATVIWYNPSASGAQLEQLKGFYDQEIDEAAVGQDRVIVAPYDYPGEGGQLPDGVMMATTAWQRLQNCTQVNLAVAFDFASQFSAPPFEGREYAGEAPEAGAGL